jgi:hypothetical protein
MRKYDLGLVFTGHMMDAPGRKEPRFPAAMHREAADSIRYSINSNWFYSDEMLFVSSAARGADIMALEIAQARRMDVKIVLPHPVDVFIKWSIGEPDPFCWERRMRAVLDGADVEVLPGESTLDKTVSKDYSRVNARMTEIVGEFANRKKLLAFWDGKGGLEGGTGHFCESFRSLGGEVEVIDTNAMLQRLANTLGCHE